MPSNVEDLPTLFTTIKSRFPPSLGPHAWYIAASSVLITATNPANINHLYTHLLTLPDFATPAQRRALSQRLHAQFLKQWTVIGIPRVITAVRALATIEAAGDSDAPTVSTHEGQQLDAATRARGLALCHTIYGAAGYGEIEASWGSMRADMSWLAENVIYGLFLSDESVMGGAETALMSYACMASMDLLGTSRRHLVGLRNHGVSEEDLLEVVECVKMLAMWAGKDVSEWVRVEDLRTEVEKRRMHDLIRTGKV